MKLIIQHPHTAHGIKLVLNKDGITQYTTNIKHQTTHNTQHTTYSTKHTPHNA